MVCRGKSFLQQRELLWTILLKLLNLDDLPGQHFAAVLSTSEDTTVEL